MTKDDPTKTDSERLQGFANVLHAAMIAKYPDASVSIHSNGFEVTATLTAEGLDDTYSFDLQCNFIRHFKGV